MKPSFSLFLLSGSLPGQYPATLENYNAAVQKRWNRPAMEKIWEKLEEQHSQTETPGT